ncbi:MAG: hypothetical protein ABSH05_22515 [Bryobacteraceae bacterium]|jgi:hypothetical protein
MKKPKPIKISRQAVRKSIRKPMPPPAKVYKDRRKADREREIEKEQLEDQGNRGTA